MSCSLTKSRFPWSLALGLVLGCGPSVFAAPAEVTPYEPDEFTLHLWHLDELKPPFRDQIKGGLDLKGLLNNAAAGVPSMNGLGTGVSFNHDAGGQRGSFQFKGAILLAAPELANGNADNAPASFRFAGREGAFTIEALVHFDVLPSDAGSVAMDIVSMDGEGNDRVFNFRVESSGFLAFVPLSSRGGALAAIPTTGPHAVNTSDWFHIAVTYDGKEGLANNIKLYWTRLDSAQPSAHLIGRGTLADDLGVKTADFSIGNEARTWDGNAEGEPFRGVVDEVRISSVARDPAEFLFVAPGLRSRAGTASGKDSRPLNLRLSGMIVDGKEVDLPSPGSALSLPPGLHRVSIDFGIPPEQLNQPATFRCRLKGLDERWNESGRGMAMTCEVLDEYDAVVSAVQFPVLGASRGWQTSVEDSTMTRRSEPFQVPSSGKSIRITLASGTDDTTGIFVIDDLNLFMKQPGVESVPIWENPRFDKGAQMESPAGVPEHWLRGGSAPTIARVAKTSSGVSIALVDGDQAASGIWTRTQRLPKIAPGGETMLLTWNGMYNVIGGSLQRATFVNLPPGDYSFEAIATSGVDARAGSHVALPFKIRAPLSDRPWFWAVVAACVVGSLAVGIVAHLRHKAAKKLHKMRVQNALAQDRARIARDLHDDLGTRVTMLTMNASLAQRDIERSPSEALRHLGNLSASARDLVAAMDGMVWVVDPTNDTLDHLGQHLAGLAQEIFRDSQVRCLVEIPHVLPALTLRSDFRNHVSLAVKEALHNILRHAGPCEATLSLEVATDRLEIVISDNGRGFDTTSPDAGNGLGNQGHRMKDLGGTCKIESTPGKGTTVVMSCPLPKSTVKPS